MKTRDRPRLLIVAGRDPSGAGLDADLEAVADLGVDAVCVTTALTDQDDLGVRDLGARDPADWLREAREACSARGSAERGVAAVKFGLLPGAAHAQAAAGLARDLRRRFGAGLPLVLDPVLRASSGFRFLDDRGVEALRGGLLAQGVIVTPNLPEAAELACEPPAKLRSSPQARVEAARILLALGAAAVVIKGGHGDEDPARDLVAFADGRVAWRAHPRVAGGKLRGSGCRFASRLAAGLALGRSLEDCVADAGTYVAGRIREGAGRAG